MNGRPCKQRLTPRTLKLLLSRRAWPGCRRPWMPWWLPSRLAGPSTLALSRALLHQRQGPRSPYRPRNPRLPSRCNLLPTPHQRREPRGSPNARTGTMPQNGSRGARTLTCEGAGAGLVRCRGVHSRTLWPLTPEASIESLHGAVALVPSTASLVCGRLLLPDSSLSLLPLPLVGSVKPDLLSSVVPMRGEIAAAAVVVPPTSYLICSQCASTSCLRNRSTTA